MSGEKFYPQTAPQCMSLSPQKSAHVVSNPGKTSSLKAYPHQRRGGCPFPPCWLPFWAPISSFAVERKPLSDYTTFLSVPEPLPSGRLHPVTQASQAGRGVSSPGKRSISNFSSTLPARKQRLRVLWKPTDVYKKVGLWHCSGKACNYLQGVGRGERERVRMCVHACV